MIKIILTRTASSKTPEQQHTWPLKVTALGEGVSSSVFVYAVGDSVNGDTFQCVASVSQMSELGETAGAVSLGENRQIPFYRKNTAEFSCRSADEVEKVWDTILRHTKQLIENLNSLESLEARPSTVTITTGS